MPIASVNPATGETIKTYDEHTPEQVEEKLARAQSTFETWRETSFGERAQLMLKLASLLKKNSRQYGEILTNEMGKPISQAIAEVEKCAWVCEYYAAQAEGMLQPEHIKSDGQESYVEYNPVGIILAVMPWNYPLWQVFRFIAPAAMAGNVGVLKHASNVPASALLIEQLFNDAGFPNGVFQTLLIGAARVEGVLTDSRVKAATLTGSGPAGSKVAEIAGREIKKTVLELGGSDPFIILDDANLDEATGVACTARLQNNGQSCIAGKRFIVVASRAEEFLEKYKQQFERMIVGDPMDEKTQIGPIVNEKSMNEIAKQVDDSVAKGARIVTGGKRIGDKGFYYAPTILTDLKPGMPAYADEIFGPVASVLIVKDAYEAVALANSIDFGLGASLWTQDLDLAKKLATHIESGAVFINGLVKSDPRLPFGGVKKSGYGRELSHHGIKEFMNIKTVWVK